MEIPDHLTCLLRTLCAGQEAIEPDMKQQTGSKLGKKYIKAVYYHLAYLAYMESTSCKMLGWMNHKLESSLLGESEEESEKTGLKLSIQKTEIMASSPITSWQVDGDKVETVTHFIFFGTRITADCDCHHEIERHLLLGKKAVTNLDNILKSRDITLPERSI